ncbi:MAG TPA: phosphodiester glycosidase family protein [Nitrospiraceae bacterium]
MTFFGRMSLAINASFVAALLIVAPGLGVAQDLAWDRLAEGLEVTAWTPGETCQQVPALFILRINSEHFRFAVHHYRAEGLKSPLTLDEWQQWTKAPVLFNAGLFLDDFSYLGLLYKDGKSIGGKRHGQWQGLFVAEPANEYGTREKVRVLDLSTDAFDPIHPAYKEAAQSLMLLDRHGTPRVRRSGKSAQQTVVGEDRKGHILVIMTKGATPLWELAVCLRDGVGGLTLAMAMDGGDSSDLLIGSEIAGAHADAAWQPLVDGKGQSHIPLPTVIGVFPRK